MSYNKFLFCLLFFTACNAAKKTPSNPATSSEPHRPVVHFTPEEHWMNDPNGMVYYNGVYQLFYQYYPGGTKWGPMHWGHATSTDLVHWTHQPIALYPDSLGYIFSGSAVVDEHNTSGFAPHGEVPLVAIFTQHDPSLEKQGRIDYQTQSIAYSLDQGKTWVKYPNNPVIKNPGTRDFRDPKVSWFEPAKKWIMALATFDHITFYSSPDLKTWSKESEFGKTLGAHGGVWECPDLFQLDHNGRKVWVLLVNLNPGGPNGGSATQYFIGDFDGKTFTPSYKGTRWADYGPDEYAGVTWSNTGNRKIFLGWMSNWMYAESVPTERWRSAMTIPRDLSIKQVGNDLFLASRPAEELDKLKEYSTTLNDLKITDQINLSGKIKNFNIPCRLYISMNSAADFSLAIYNELGEEVIVGFDRRNNQYFIDRTNSGKVAFHKDFARRHLAPRLSKENNLDMTLIIDVSSVELFADDGLSVMTEIFFPNKPFNQLRLSSKEAASIDKLSYAGL